MKKVVVFAWLVSLACSVVTPCEIPSTCQTDFDCNNGECCREVTFGRDRGSYCITVPVHNELCDPDEELSCPCAGNSSCQTRGLYSHSQTNRKLKTYLQDIYTYNHQGNQTCPDKSKIQREGNDYVCGEMTGIESHLQSGTAGAEQLCSGDGDCGAGECCIQITCASNEQMHAMSVCIAIPQHGDPCDPKSTGTSLTCPCGHNLTCSFSATTKYEYYREKYYKCICKHTPASKECSKYKHIMEELKSRAGSVCRPPTDPMFEQCGTRSQACGPGRCCLEITCASIEKKPKVDTLSICDQLPDIGDPCDTGPTGTSLACPCRHGLICSHSEITRFSYYRKKFYRCLCRNPSNSNECDKYEKQMQKHKSNAGSICKPRPQTTPSSCSSNQDCGWGHCCVEVACEQNSNNEFTPKSVAFCLPTPGEDETCDPDGTFLCPCEHNHDCVRPTNETPSNDVSAHINYDSHKQEKEYASCLCTNYFSPSECHNTLRNMTSTWNARCQRGANRPLTAALPKPQPSVAPITTPIVAPINTPHAATVPPVILATTTDTPVRCAADVDCGAGECCIEVSCGKIEKRPRVDKVSVCGKFPQNGEPCDPGLAGTLLSCTCAQNLICSHPETTKHGYHRERFFKCLCRNPDDTEKCDKYKKNMVKYVSIPGSVCRHIPQPRLNLCGSQGCRQGQCCMEMACRQNSNNEFTPDSVSFCLSTPGLYERCDPDDNSLCPCQAGLSCIRLSDDHHRESSTHNNYDPHKEEKDFANCLCNHFSTPQVCQYTPRVSSERRSQWYHNHPQCRRIMPSTFQKELPPINTAEPPHIQ